MTGKRVDILLATRSADKSREIRNILADVEQLRLLDLDVAGIPWSGAEDGIEVFETFEDNARAKAEYFRWLSGLPTLADDSGLEVDALGGRPGVHSKRYAPAHEVPEGEGEQDRANNEHLLWELGDLPLADRSARYVCVAVLVEVDGTIRSFRGEAPGLILDEPRGRGGFGYDPLFFDPAIGKTFAEIPAADKNARSHRARAFRSIADHLSFHLGNDPPNAG